MALQAETCAFPICCVDRAPAALCPRCPHSPPCSAFFLQVDDSARRVERGVLGGRLQGGVAGEAVGRGPVRQEALLPQKRLRQVSLGTPVQLRGKVIRASSEQLIPAPVQQDLVLADRPEKAACWLLGPRPQKLVLGDSDPQSSKQPSLQILDLRGGEVRALYSCVSWAMKPHQTGSIPEKPNPADSEENHSSLFSDSSANQLYSFP